MELKIKAELELQRQKLDYFARDTNFIPFVISHLYPLATWLNKILSVACQIGARFAARNQSMLEYWYPCDKEQKP